MDGAAAAAAAAAAVAEYAAVQARTGASAAPANQPDALGARVASQPQARPWPLLRRSQQSGGAAQDGALDRVPTATAVVKRGPRARLAAAEAALRAQAAARLRGLHTEARERRPAAEASRRPQATCRRGRGRAQRERGRG